MITSVETIDLFPCIDLGKDTGILLIFSFGLFTCMMCDVMQYRLDRRFVYFLVERMMWIYFIILFL